MEVKSISDCLNRIDIVIFEKSLKDIVEGNLDYIGNHIDWQEADVVARGEYIE